MKVDMSAPLLDRKGEQVEEPEINARNQIVLEDGTAKSRKDFNPRLTRSRSARCASATRS